MNPIPTFKKTLGRPHIDVSLDEKAEIGSHVFIGANAIVCKGVTISDNAIVAAGSVVVKSIPAGEVWGGNPACRITVGIGSQGQANQNAKP